MYRVLVSTKRLPVLQVSNQKELFSYATLSVDFAPELPELWHLPVSVLQILTISDETLSWMQFLQLHLAVTVLAAESSVLPVLLSVHIRSRRSRQHCMRWVFPPNRHRYTRRSLLSSSLRSRRLRLRII